MFNYIQYKLEDKTLISGISLRSFMKQKKKKKVEIDQRGYLENMLCRPDYNLCDTQIPYVRQVFGHISYLEARIRFSKKNIMAGWKRNIL